MTGVGTGVGFGVGDGVGVGGSDGAGEGLSALSTDSPAAGVGDCVSDMGSPLVNNLSGNKKITHATRQAHINVIPKAKFSQARLARRFTRLPRCLCLLLIRFSSRNKFHILYHSARETRNRALGDSV